MKKYQELKIELLILTEEDVVTASGFAGKPHEFGAPDNANGQAFTLGQFES